jgi:hypothetical protein
MTLYYVEIGSIVYYCRVPGVHPPGRSGIASVKSGIARRSEHRVTLSNLPACIIYVGRWRRPHILYSHLYIPEYTRNLQNKQYF